MGGGGAVGEVCLDSGQELGGGGVEGQVRGLREVLRKAICDQHADGCAVF